MALGSFATFEGLHSKSPGNIFIELLCHGVARRVAQRIPQMPPPHGLLHGQRRGRLQRRLSVWVMS